ncbi:MAG: peptidylprolyl isomerase [Erysipelotrichaceae bacterium]|nr:peptidylprolyl isomerase [Erysipelotrichaceae bacterium]
MIMIKGQITMANHEVIPFVLFEEEAPITVANFVRLIQEGYYNGKTFHRVIPHFVSQGGCPYGNGMGDLGYTIPCETKGNPHRHVEGALSMAHRGKDTGCCQFFIVHDPQPHLDGVHTVFGQVTDNMKAVKAMRNGDVMEKVEIL